MRNRFPKGAAIAAAAVATAGLAGSASAQTLPAIFTATPTDLAFGSLATGGTKALDVAIGVGDIQAGTLELKSAPAISGTDAADFTITGGNCAVGYKYTPDSKTPCTTSVTFAPKSAGTKSATLTVTGGFVLQVLSLAGTSECTGLFYNPTCTVTVPLTGTAVAPVVGAALTPARRTIRARQTAKVTLTATNPGTTSLTNVTTSLPVPAGFVAVSLGGATRAGRTLTWTAASIAPGATASSTVVLRPIGLTARRGSLVSTVTADGATPVTARGTVIVRAIARPVTPVTG